MANYSPLLNQRIGANIGLGAVCAVNPFALNLAYDEIAELVALDWCANIQAPADPADGTAYAWFSLDPNDVTKDIAEPSSDCMMLVALMALHTSGTGLKVEDVKRGFDVYPSGIYVAVNPILGVQPHADAGVRAYANLFYRVVKPSPAQLSLVIARRR